jgi:hypothetical protein
VKYLWTEDTGAGLHFWKLVSQLFFDNEDADVNSVREGTTSNWKNHYLKPPMHI